MSNKYTTSPKIGIIESLLPGPDTSYVIDRETGNPVGEIAHWSHQSVGELIADGKWQPYEKEE